MVEFLNGHSFFVAKLHEHYGATAVALHATYQFGDSPEYSYGKRERLRRAGLWAVDDHEYYTPPKLLVIKGDLLQGFSMSADYDETVRARSKTNASLERGMDVQRIADCRGLVRSGGWWHRQAPGCQHSAATAAVGCVRHLYHAGPHAGGAAVVVLLRPLLVAVGTP